jgi:hypothetical protein
VSGPRGSWALFICPQTKWEVLKGIRLNVCKDNILVI